VRLASFSLFDGAIVARLRELGQYLAQLDPPPFKDLTMQVVNSPLDSYLSPSNYIDFTHPLIAEKAQQLARDHHGELELAKACFEFVRDGIQHSWDFRKNLVTCKASDVLIHGTGYCYAKSHLLAALLRANNIPAGLCYQRLSVGTAGAPYCLHGLNAIYLKDFGWYRVDPRGNKPGVSAQFTPPEEQLAFAINEQQEKDLPEIRAEPMPIIVATLEKYSTVMEVYENLPDII
jgi:transglutaminase-like putative cysteine protease